MPFLYIPKVFGEGYTKNVVRQNISLKRVLQLKFLHCATIYFEHTDDYDHLFVGNKSDHGYVWPEGRRRFGPFVASASFIMNMYSGVADHL